MAENTPPVLPVTEAPPTTEDLKKWPFQFSAGAWTLIVFAAFISTTAWFISKKYTEMEQTVKAFEQKVDAQKELLQSKYQYLEEKIRDLKTEQDRQRTKIESMPPPR